MRLITENHNIIFEDYGLLPNVTAYDQTPARRYRKEQVIGRDGELTFIDGMNNKRVTVLFYFTEGSLSDRRRRVRDITPALLEGGDMIFNFDNDIKYRVQVLDVSDIQLNFSLDELTVTFEMKPHAVPSSDDEELVWETTDVSWESLDVRWDGADLKRTFHAGTSTIYNRGNVVSHPLFIMSGAGTATVGTQSFTVTEACTVDTDRLVVYSGTTNKITSFSGDFIMLPVGESSITSTVALEIANKDRWI